MRVSLPMLPSGSLSIDGAVGSMKLFLHGALAPAIVVCGIATCSAGEVDLWSIPRIDPIRQASAPLDMGDGLPLAAGGWRLTATVGYFNVIANSWHLPAIHGEFGLLGRPIESWELRLLENRHPTDHSYVVDVEGWQTELRVSRGFRAGIVVSLRVPWIEIGTPHWDGVASTTHGVLGAADIGSWTARGETAVYAHGDLGVVDRTSGLAESGWGDATLAVSGALGRLLSGRHRWGVALEAPTGARDSLMGSGGWDVGLRWYGTWEWGRNAIVGGLGFVHLDDGGDWLGVQRASLWQLHVEYVRQLGAAWSLRGAIHGATSPLADFADSELGESSVSFEVGLRAALSEESWLAFSFGENPWYTGTLTGVQPDYTLQLQIGATLRPADD
jgi:hypothetical protein